MVAWTRSVPRQLQFLSVISILEIDDPLQAKSLHRWLDENILISFAGRILPVSLGAAELCASLHIPTEREDLDLLIAATALFHDFTVVTHNVRHFEPTGVRVLNPWD